MSGHTPEEIKQHCKKYFAVFFALVHLAAVEFGVSILKRRYLLVEALQPFFGVSWLAEEE